jgi:hypothetical protein
MNEFKLDAMWVIIFILSGFVFIYLIIVLTLFFLSFLETRFNINCVCRGWRLDSNPNIIIPLYCYCVRNNNNVQILPVNKIPKIITLEEYNKKTNNLMIINPDNKFFIGIPKNN